MSFGHVEKNALIRRQSHHAVKDFSQCLHPCNFFAIHSLAVNDLVSLPVLRSEIGKVIIGQDEVVQDVLISIFSRGHCLLVGVPGLAKTLLVNTIAQTLASRIVAARRGEVWSESFFQLEGAVGAC